MEAGSNGIRVSGLATTPVKGTRLHLHQQLTLERLGAPDNRRFHLIDERARMVNGKQVAGLSAVVADYDAGPDVLTLTFPDGTVVSEQVTLGASIESRFYSTQAQARLVIGPWSRALSLYSGERLRLVLADPSYGGIDRGPVGAVTLISRASIARLEALADTPVDARRFRMLIEVDGSRANEEDEWVGGRLRVGGALLAMRGHVGRCLVTSQDPDSGIADLPTLDLLRSYRGGVETTEPLALGIFGEVLEPGPVRLGDEVLITPGVTGA